MMFGVTNQWNRHVECGSARILIVNEYNYIKYIILDWVGRGVWNLTFFNLYLGDCFHVIEVWTESGEWAPMLLSGVSHLTSTQAALYLTSQPVKCAQIRSLIFQPPALSNLSKWIHLIATIRKSSFILWSVLKLCKNNTLKIKNKVCIGVLETLPKEKRLIFMSNFAVKFPMRIDLFTRVTIIHSNNI